MSAPLRGFGFPFRIANGGVTWSEGADKVSENLHQLLMTRLGERVMRRTYGAGLHAQLHQPNDEILRAVVQYTIEQALRTYLPDAQLVGQVSVESRQAQLLITFEYTAAPGDIVRRLQIEL